MIPFKQASTSFWTADPGVALGLALVTVPMAASLWPGAEGPEASAVLPFSALILQMVTLWVQPLLPLSHGPHFPLHFIWGLVPLEPSQFGLV